MLLHPKFAGGKADLVHWCLDMNVPRVIERWPDLIRKVVANVVQHDNEVLDLGCRRVVVPTQRERRSCSMMPELLLKC